MPKTQEKLILEQIAQKEKEIQELKDLFVNLELKRIERDDKERETLKSGEEYDDPSNVIMRVIAYCRESPFSLGGLKKDKPMRKLDGDLSGLLYEPGIPTRDGVAFEEPVTKLQRYKGRMVNPDTYNVVGGKLYFKKPHEDCGGNILVTECGISGWDHGHAQCTKCGKYIGGWISGADGMPFNG